MTKKELVNKALQISRKIEQLKKLYAEQDEIVEQLVDLSAMSGEGWEVVDNYKSNVIFRTTSVKRYTFKELK